MSAKKHKAKYPLKT